MGNKMKPEAPVGVLALQGAYNKHQQILASMNVSSRLVRQINELQDCSALIIPGGESTTMSLLIEYLGFHDALCEFAQTRPLMGVCAGMIIMANTVDDDRIAPLGILPVKIQRNYYGSQVSSFSADINLRFDSAGSSFPAHFIRAPVINELDNRIEVLAEYDSKPVMIQAGRHIALSFHPELTEDSRIHQYWLKSNNKVMSN